MFENVIEVPVQLHKISRGEAISRAIKLLEKVGMADKKDEYPSHLSGRQSQRLAIARALAMQPAFLLLDNPHQH